MKKNNPHIPIMLREALGTEPRVFARYGTPDQHTLGDPRLRLTDWNRVREGEAGIAIWYESILAILRGLVLRLSLLGLSDKEIEDSVTGLVKTGI